MTPQSRILCHRGLWDDPTDGNSTNAILQAISEGYGVEFDVRDHLGHVVVAHDPPIQDFFYTKLPSLLEDLSKIGLPSNLAINVKSDGLEPLMPQIDIPHFFFDMSLPDHIAYQKANRRVAIRVSEHEPLSSSDVFTHKEILWIDAFTSDWYLKEDIFRSLMNKRATKIFVSPELHGRDFENLWKALRPRFLEREDLMICTDYPRVFLESL